MQDARLDSQEAMLDSRTECLEALKNTDNALGYDEVEVVSLYYHGIFKFLQRQMQEWTQSLAYSCPKPGDLSENHWTYVWKTLKDAIANGKDILGICGILRSFVQTWEYNAVNVTDRIPPRGLMDDRRDLDQKFCDSLEKGPSEVDELTRRRWEDKKNKNVMQVCVLKAECIDWGRRVSDGAREAKYDGESVTVHKLELDGDVLDQALEGLLEQLAELNSRRFPYASPFHGVCASGYLTVERGEKDLMEWYKRSTDLNWRRKIRVLREAARALRMVHGLPTVHKSVGSRSFYVSEGRPQLVQIVDLSSISEVAKARTVAWGGARDFGPSVWVAPELFDGAPYSFDSDVFAFGVVLYEVAAQRQPYGMGSTHAEVWRKKKSGVAPCAVPEDCPKQLHVLMQECCSMEPTARPKMEEVVQRLQELSLQI